VPESSHQSQVAHTDPVMMAMYGFAAAKHNQALRTLSQRDAIYRKEIVHGYHGKGSRLFG